MGAVPTKMMYVKSDGVPWHGIGTALDNPPTMEEAIDASGLGWDTGLAPVYAHIKGNYVKTDRRAIYRTDTQEVLGIASEDYAPLNNREAFQIADAVVSDLGIEARYTTAGDLFGGKQVFIVAKLPEDIIIGSNDRSEQYLLLRTGHDGGTSFDIVPTSVRVVCQNTLNLALGRAGQVRYSTFHNGDWDEKTKQIRMYFKESMARLSEFKDLGNKLVEIGSTAEAESDMIDALFPRVQVANVVNVRLSQPSDNPVDATWLVPAAQLAQWEKRRANKISIFKDVRKQEDGSLWGLLSSATGYADQARPGAWKDPQVRLRSIMWRTSAQLKDKAMQVVEAHANG